MTLSSAVVTIGPLCRIEGQLPSHAVRMATNSGAFQHGGELMCRRRDWDRVSGALRAAGVIIRTDEGGSPGRATLSLGSGSTGRVEGVLPRRIERTWLGRVQGRSLANITPYSLQEVRDALLEEKVAVEVKPDYRSMAVRMDDLSVDVMDSLSTPDEDLPDVKLLTGALRPYQRRALAYGDACQGRFYLCDEAGVGKTMSAIAYALHRGVQRVLIICPGSIKGQWRDEIKTYAGGEVFIAQGRRPERIPASTKWLITNQDILKDRYDDFALYNADLVIRDEAHTDKKPEADRVKALMALAGKARFYIPLTGTPVDNLPIDAWVQLHILQPNWWGSRYEFGLVFCGPVKNWSASKKAGRDIFDFKGVTQATKPVLQERLRHVMLRRLIRDVGLQMPEQTRTRVRVELDRGAREGYDTVLAEYRTLLREARANVHTEREVEAQLEKLRPQRAKLAMRMRRASSMGRIPDTVEMVQRLVEAGERVVVFGFYRETLEALRDAMKAVKLKADLIYGGDQARREDVIQAFKDGKLDVLVSSIQVGGVGLNFQHVSRTTISHELSFKPIDIPQSEARVFRSGQTKAVQHHYVLGEDTMDERVLNILFKKMAATDAFVNGDEMGTEDEILRELESSFFTKEKTVG